MFPSVFFQSVCITLFPVTFSSSFAYENAGKYERSKFLSYSFFFLNHRLSFDHFPAPVSSFILRPLFDLLQLHVSAGLTLVRAFPGNAIFSDFTFVFGLPVQYFHALPFVWSFLVTCHHYLPRKNVTFGRQQLEKSINSSLSFFFNSFPLHFF